MFHLGLRKEDRSVVCRPGALGWVIVVVFTGYGIMLPMITSSGPHIPSDTASIVVLSMLFFAPALWLAMWLLRARIEADEHGLRWRGVWEWHATEWADVTDYYECVLPKGKKETIIETRGGKVKFGGGMWKDSTTLRAMVEINAAHARAHTWGILGLRPEQDWPRTFRYDTRENRFAPVWMGGALLMLAGLWAWRCIPKLIETFGTTEWTWTLAGSALFGFVLLCQGVLCGLALRAAWDTKHRFGEGITVSKNGVVFRSSVRTFTAAWSDITAYHAVYTGFTYRYVIETTKGQFDFVSTLKDGRVLSVAIQQNAQASSQNGWQTPDEESLGGHAARWSSGCEGVGERVFHYRTRTNRAMLWLPTALLIMFILLMLSGLGTIPLPVILIFTVFTGWGWNRYFRASVRVGDGLTLKTIFGLRKLAWSEIDDFYLSGDDGMLFGNVTGNGKRIRFWIGINNVEELKREIVHHALYSRSHAWELHQKETRKAQTLTRQ